MLTGARFFFFLGGGLINLRLRIGTIITSHIEGESTTWGREVGDGGGLAGIFAGEPSRDTALAIAGGGGGASDGRNGKEGTPDASNLHDCSSLQGRVASSTHRGGGGGGYCGGNAKSHGAGGVNFIHKDGKTIANKVGQT